MKHQFQQMIDERTQFFQNWLTSASSHENRDCQQFYNSLFKLLETDQLAQQIFYRNFVGFFQSRQSNLHRIFQYCLSRPNKIYEKKICIFLQQYLNEKNQISLSIDMQKYIIHNIWKQQMEPYFIKCRFTPYKIIEFLSLKMRSLESQTRFQAVNTLIEIVQMKLQGWKSPLAHNISNMLPQMIEKENYGKEVCHSKGVLLQILQDQFCKIKKRGIQLLGKAKCFFATNMIRPLILYMLNDQHQVVRQTCLVVLSQIPQLDIEKEDLSALLVCLKQNNTLMRSYTYENLSHINITSAEDFKIIMEKLFFTLQNRLQDKKKIYIVCSKLGRKYPNFVLANLQYIYRYTDNEQPNWKYISYRARLITVAAIGRQNWPKNLPKYFANHYLYMRDVLLYAFEPKSLNNKPLNDINQQMAQTQQISHQVSINLISNWQIYQFVKATECITQGFLKSLFQIILKYLQQTKLGRIYVQQDIALILRQLERLQVMYDVTSALIASDVISQLARVIKSNSMQQVKNWIEKIRQNQIWIKLQKIQTIIFKVSSTDKTKVIISNRENILNKSFIQFSNSINNQTQIHKQVGFLRMSQVDFQQISSKMCYYKINFKCKQIRCLILYSHPPVYHVTDTYSIEESTFKHGL